jgi:membrane protein DedA with SNARE-associated domain
MTWMARVWKYIVFGASSIIGEETNPILGGIAARHGRADLLAVIVAVALGTWIASMALYYIGYARIGWVRSRWPQKEALIESALDVVRRHQWGSALMVRFAYGLRLPLPIACGAARMPMGIYFVASGISCWVWAIAFSYLGVAFGGAAIRVLQFLQLLEVRLGVLAIILFVVLVIVRRRRIVAERRAAEQEAEDEE